MGKSTVPVGTAARLDERLATVGASLAWNLEFLQEGFAVQDTIAPDRLVYGVRRIDAGLDEVPTGALDEVYAAPLATGTP